MFLFQLITIMTVNDFSCLVDVLLLKGELILIIVCWPNCTIYFLLFTFLFLVNFTPKKLIWCILSQFLRNLWILLCHFTSNIITIFIPNFFWQILPPIFMFINKKKLLEVKFTSFLKFGIKCDKLKY